MKDLLSTDELAEIGKRSDLQAAWLVFCNYAITAAIFTVMALWPNPLTILVGILLLGGRQLGFGVLVHECGHGTLFANRRLNEWVGEWLAAPPTFNNMKSYSRGHLKHHQLAGTREDPDLPNYQDYPISRERLRRKIWRDSERADRLEADPGPAEWFCEILSAAAGTAPGAGSRTGVQSGDAGAVYLRWCCLAVSGLVGGAADQQSTRQPSAADGGTRRSARSLRSGSTAATHAPSRRAGSIAWYSVLWV